MVQVTWATLFKIVIVCIICSLFACILHFYIVYRLYNLYDVCVNDYSKYDISLARVDIQRGCMLKREVRAFRRSPCAAVQGKGWILHCTGKYDRSRREFQSLEPIGGCVILI